MGIVIDFASCREGVVEPAPSVKTDETANVDVYRALINAVVGGSEEVYREVSEKAPFPVRVALLAGRVQHRSRR